MVWRFIMNQVSSMPKQFRTIKQQFDQVFQGINTQPPRSITCAEYVNNIMGPAVAKLYINEYFDTNARNEVPKITAALTDLCLFFLQSLQIIDNIRNAFIDMVNQSTWMDSVSKTKAIDKVR
jgi:predicted metalloendopeptidase